MVILVICTFLVRLRLKLSGFIGFLIQTFTIFNFIYCFFNFFLCKERFCILANWIFSLFTTNPISFPRKVFKQKMAANLSDPISLIYISRLEPWFSAMEEPSSSLTCPVQLLCSVCRCHISFPQQIVHWPYPHTAWGRVLSFMKLCGAFASPFHFAFRFFAKSVHYGNLTELYFIFTSSFHLESL